MVVSAQLFIVRRRQSRKSVREVWHSAAVAFAFGRQVSPFVTLFRMNTACTIHEPPGVSRQSATDDSVCCCIGHLSIGGVRVSSYMARLRFFFFFFFFFFIH